MSRIPSMLLPFACACLIALGAPAQARAAKPALSKGCPKFKGEPTGYMIGSSTMGSVLGPMLKGMLKRRWKVESRHWGKASSGLARPDFHDWPRKAKGLMARYRPDFVIVSLGTNDNQALRIGKKWLRPKHKKRWEKLYAERVRKMLKNLAGPDLARPIIWMGPTAFEGKTARILGPRINAIMQREVEAFEGNAAFINVYRATRKPNGKMVTSFQAPDRKGPEGLRGADGIHLTARAVKYLMAEPALKPLAPCFAEHLAEWKKEQERKAAERRKKAAERKAERERLRAERKAQRIEAYKQKLEKKRKAKEARLEARRLRMAKKKAKSAPADEQAKTRPGEESPERPAEKTKQEDKKAADGRASGADGARPKPSPKKKAEATEPADAVDEDKKADATRTPPETSEGDESPEPRPLKPEAKD